MVQTQLMVAAFAMLFGVAQLVVSDTTKPADADSGKKPERDPQFDACDVSTDDSNITQTGNGLIWENSNDPNFFLAPGLGACGGNYTDQSNVVCLKPGWVNSAHVNKCNTWVQAYLPETGVVTQGYVFDACGALENTTFGCNDIYVSKRMFEQLAGNQRKKAIDDGRLPGQIQWRFTTEPCWACAAGLKGIYPNGTQDTCTGEDSMGFTRCGRRSGDQRIVGAAADYICNQQVDSCSKVESMAAQLPKYKGKSSDDTYPPSQESQTTGTTDSKKSTSGPNKSLLQLMQSKKHKRSVRAATI